MSPPPLPMPAGAHGQVCIFEPLDENSPTTEVLMSEVNKLLQIYYTLPVISATAERTFSAMRVDQRVYEAKSDPERLSNEMLMHCHKDRVDVMYLITVAKTFIGAIDRHER